MSKSSSMFRICAHWRGEQDLVQAFGPSLVMVIAPLIAGCTLCVLLRQSFPASAQGTALFFLDAGGLLTILAGLWWCKGAHAMSMRMLTGNHMGQAALTFLASMMGFLLLVLCWIPILVQSTNEDWALIRKPRELGMASQWQGSFRVDVLPELKRFKVAGPISEGSAKILESSIVRHPEIRLVELESPGGFVREADLMVLLLRQHQLDTLVQGKCYSACTEIFLAGERRFVGTDASFGFHQSGYTGRPLDTQWSITEHESAIFYRERGVSREFSQIALNTSYYGLWRPHVYDVKISGFATHWWSERPHEY